MEGFVVISPEQVRPKSVGVADKPSGWQPAGVYLHELIWGRERASEEGCERLCGWSTSAA